MSKLIGTGYFYNVYEHSPHRVVKRTRGLWNILQTKRPKHIVEVLKQNKVARKNTKIVKSKLDSLPGDIFGNPKFISRYDYIQDKVAPLHKYMEVHSLEENKKMIDRYFEIIMMLMEYGIHDHVYKFKDGYGVNNEGNLIYVDFNEIYTSKDKVLRLIRNREWEKEMQLTKLPKGELKEYINKSYEKNLTIEQVDKRWGLLL